MKGAFMVETSIFHGTMGCSTLFSDLNIKPMIAWVIIDGWSGQKNI